MPLTLFRPSVNDVQQIRPDLLITSSPSSSSSSISFCFCFITRANSSVTCPISWIPISYRKNNDVIDYNYINLNLVIISRFVYIDVAQIHRHSLLHLMLLMLLVLLFHLVALIDSTSRSCHLLNRLLCLILVVRLQWELRSFVVALTRLSVIALLAY